MATPNPIKAAIVCNKQNTYGLQYSLIALSFASSSLWGKSIRIIILMNRHI